MWLGKQLITKKVAGEAANHQVCGLGNSLITKNVIWEAANHQDCGRSYFPNNILGDNLLPKPYFL
jgi:phytoene/squalene synthetase